MRTTCIVWMTENMVVRKVTDDRKTVLTRNPWNHKGRRMHHVGKYRYWQLLIIVLWVYMTLYNYIYTHFTWMSYTNILACFFSLWTEERVCLCFFWRWVTWQDLFVRINYTVNLDDLLHLKHGLVFPY